MDFVRVAGKALFTLRENGIIIKQFYYGNLITELGEAWIANQCTDDDDPAAGWIAVGDGGGQVSTDTTLDNETGRVALTSPFPNQGAGADDNDMLFDANVPSGTATGTISEVALFNAVTTGTMINYLNGFAAINKGASQDLDISMIITVGAS